MALLLGRIAQRQVVRSQLAKRHISYQQKTSLQNGLIAGTCVAFIASVYTYSISKMKQAGEDISEEIAIHESSMKHMKAEAEAEQASKTVEAIVAKEEPPQPRKKWFGIF